MTVAERVPPVLRRAPLGVLVVLALVPLTGEYAAVVGLLAVVFGLVALGYVVLTGVAGDVSLGQIVPVGLGAYATFVLSERAGLPVLLAIVLSAVVLAPLLALLGVPAMRLRGLDLAVATFALALVFQLLVFRNLGRALAETGGTPTDFSSAVVRVERPSLGVVDLESNRALYAVAVVAGGLALLAVVALVRSAFGRALLAVRDDPERAAVIGIPVRRYRLGAFVVAGMLAALAGGLLASLRQAVTPETFTVFASLDLLAMAVIGGLRTPGGAVLAGAFGALMPEVARLDPFRLLQGRLVLVYGGALVVLLAVRPGGLSSLLGWDRRPAPRLPTAPSVPAASRSRPRRSLLRVEELTVRYGGVRAVDRVSLRVASGERVALIGPNGAGKSTLFDAVSGLVAPAEGRVFFDGADVTTFAPHRRAELGLARTFQAARVFPSLTVAENLVAAAHLARIPGGPEAEAAALLDRLDLRAVAQAQPGELSFGALRTLEVGLALASRPRLLLLDEPAAGMDAVDIDRLARLVQEVSDRDGVAVLLVEHDVALVGRLATRVLVLDQGRLLAEGAPPAVAADPAVVAAFLGSRAVDLSERRLAGAGR